LLAFLLLKQRVHQRFRYTTLTMLESFRQQIANQLSAINGVDRQLILSAIDIPKAADHGDFAIAVPRLRVKGNPVQLAADWSQKAHHFYLY
jgi:arginyl-tRNA synthetase